MTSEGVEPSRPKASDLKSDVAANYTTRPITSSEGETRTHSISGFKPEWSADCLHRHIVHYWVVPGLRFTIDRFAPYDREPFLTQHHHQFGYFTISETTPEPTVLPPSRMANLLPTSRATTLPRSTSTSTVSPGTAISTPLSKFAEPVTSVVRK